MPALSFATSGMTLMVLRPLAPSVGVEERQAAGARPRPWERCSESSVLKWGRLDGGHKVQSARWER